MKKFTAVFQLDETGWWFTSVKELPGCHTQGKTLKQARQRIEEAIELFVDDDEKFEMIEELELPGKTLNLLNDYLQAQAALEAKQAQLQNLRQQAVQVLHDQLKISTRDTSQLMGISHQRVSQIIREKEKTTR